MTKPSLIFFGYDRQPHPTPKIYIRTLLYSTSVKGQFVEAMYVKLRRDDSERTFAFWGYGETSSLTVGGGLFVGQAGVSLNHHFGLSVKSSEYEFLEGKYTISVFAQLVGRSSPMKLDTITVNLSKGEAGALAGRLGVLFEFGWGSGRYEGHAIEYVPLIFDPST